MIFILSTYNIYNAPLFFLLFFSFLCFSLFFCGIVVGNSFSVVCCVFFVLYVFYVFFFILCSMRVLWHLRMCMWMMSVGDWLLLLLYCAAFSFIIGYAILLFLLFFFFFLCYIFFV